MIKKITKIRKGARASFLVEKYLEGGTGLSAESKVLSAGCHPSSKIPSYALDKDGFQCLKFYFSWTLPICRFMRNPNMTSNC